MDPSDVRSPTAIRLKANTALSPNASRNRVNNYTLPGNRNRGSGGININSKGDLIDLNHANWPKNLEQTTSPLQFTILSIAQSFDMRIPQAAQLLANN